MKPTTNLEKPLVSVITPTLNRARRIPEAIKSVLNQTLTDWEHIIIDDGSKDNTEDVVRKFPDHRIIYVNRFEQRGIGDTRNLGLRLASGKYIAFLDSDDMLPKGSLATRVKFFESHPKTALVFGRMDVEKSKKYLAELKRISPRQTTVVAGKRKLSDPPEMALMKKLRRAKDKFDLLLKGNFIPSGSVMVRKSILDQAGGFDTSFVVAEDYDLWLRIAKKHDIAFIDQVLLHYRRFEDSVFLSAKKQKRNQWFTKRAQQKNR